MPGARAVSILWLSKETPDRFGQGGQRRQFFQIRELVDAGVTPTVLLASRDQDSTSVQAIAAVRFLGGKRPVMPWLRSPARWLRSGGFDGLVIAHAESFDALQAGAGATPVPSLLDFHNVNSRWYRALGDSERASYWDAEESKIVTSVGDVMTCSQGELDALPAGPARGVVAPNGVDLAEWPSTEARRVPGRLVAFGSWWYPSNRKGMSWFVDQVWPLIRGQNASVTLELAGGGVPPEEVTSSAGITHVGRVEDIANFLRTASGVVMPVLQSPGTPVKFAEALASGTPLVATPEAAAGFPNAPASVTDDPTQFADRCLELVGGGVAVETAARDARDFAEAFCQWSHTQRPLVDWATGLGT